MSPQYSRSRPPKREPLDAVVGLIAGAFWGAGLGFVIGVWLLPGALLILGTLIVLSASLFAVLGYFRGDDFFRWVRDHWFDV